ncbi:sensor histidine kinase [Curtobacterium flaccumfaciens]|uniref:sensor histidine kinase n=1 Tax=Curtobacterium flaccumfaciens TaxID=2035 RepID=UPI001BDF3028|nr:GAF domain-containing protein [Curtobacterium flaccumfaciens]MBT1631537.1 GAF domain-containing protein [Curtobacterium flaccumfaciens pv. oortii]MCX2846846.1 GAF domain-containing protein [Curtobacterium flaccumfaciens pv. oortii]
MVDDLVFPDGPRSALESTIEELVDRAQAVLRTQGRLRHLLAANRRIVEHLDLEDTLRAVVHAGVELVGAQYGALGVIAPDGAALERFIHVGMDAEHVGRIGHPPRGEGLLGAVVREHVAIRIDSIASDPRSTGFPPGHPPMQGFLGVPVRVRDDVYGNLYLSDPARGHFTEEDEELIEALAATAGVAIDNARLFDEARQRERWTTAAAEVSAALVGDETLEDVLTLIADRVIAFVDAIFVSVVEPRSDPRLIHVAVAVGMGATSVQGRDYAAAGSLAGRAMGTGTVIADPTGADLPAYDWAPQLGPTLAVPLRDGTAVLGALIISRGPEARPFSENEVTMADEFGRQTSVALAVARGRKVRRLLERAEDRGRIARDLHDHVIQRLFAAGLALQATAQHAPQELRGRIDDQVATIDEAIGEIRTAVFALETPERHRPRSTRDRLLEVVAELSPALTTAPRIGFSGPVDTVITGDLAHDVVAVVRESLANVARHAPQASCRISVAISGGTVRVEIEDDGLGPGAATRRSGTANLAARARIRGGSYDLAAPPTGGTHVTWTVPIEPREMERS